eukprot:jgi/Chlat1/8950/Chrsp94S08258
MACAQAAAVIVPTVAAAAATVRTSAPRSSFAGSSLRPALPARHFARKSLNVRAQAAPKETFQVITPINGDPFIGSFETPVTSAPIVANFLSQLPAYRVGVAPLVRGVEIGLAHGFLLVGPFYKAGPLRATDAALVSGTLSAAGLVVILAACLTIYGAATFQNELSPLKSKTLTGRELPQDPLQTSAGWQSFAGGFLMGGLSGVLWAAFLLNNFAYFV